MSGNFMHVGRFNVKPEARETFIEIMKDYEATTKQDGLDHSHLIEAENDANMFWYVTIWNSRSDWEKVEELGAHKDMHKRRDPLLAQPANQNFGTVIA